MARVDLRKYARHYFYHLMIIQENWDGEICTFTL